MIQTHLCTFGASNSAEIRDRKRDVMDAKYNNFIDSLAWRVVLNLTGFGIWLGLAYALMQAAKF